MKIGKTQEYTLSYIICDEIYKKVLNYAAVSNLYYNPQLRDILKQGINNEITIIRREIFSNL
jgi:hypothetical protein